MRRALLLLTICGALLGASVPSAASATEPEAGEVVRVQQRRGMGFGLTAAGAVPVLIGVLLADLGEGAAGAPLLSAGVALEAAGSALMLPWEQLRPNRSAGREVRGPMVRVSVGYRRGGVKIGVVGRF